MCIRDRGGVFSVKNSNEFYKCFIELYDSKVLRNKSGKANSKYIIDNIEKNKKFIDSLTEKIHYL